jgi:hypothetical protein
MAFASVLVTLLIFKQQCASFLGRLRSVGKDGLKAGPSAEQPSQEADKLKQAQQLVQVFDSPVLLEREKNIKNDLQKRGLQHEGETIDVLVRYLAQSQLINTFEEAYRTIFGSQIFLLKLANQSRGSGLMAYAVAAHFTNVQKSFAPVFDQWTPEQYVAFLLSTGLLTSGSNAYYITNLGVDFLEWMVKAGIPEQRHY